MQPFEQQSAILVSFASEYLEPRNLLHRTCLQMMATSQVNPVTQLHPTHHHGPKDSASSGQPWHILPPIIGHGWPGGIRSGGQGGAGELLAGLAWKEPADRGAQMGIHRWWPSCGCCGPGRRYGGLFRPLLHQDGRPSGGRVYDGYGH